MMSVCPHYLYESTDITHQYLSKIQIRHCLCSSPDFALDLLKDDPRNDAIEWAQNREGMVTNGSILASVHQSGHVLTAIFVPIPCALSIKVVERTYYFDPDLTDDGHKFSLYVPLFCCFKTLMASIEVSPKFEGKNIPLTFFYLNLRSHPHRTSGPSIQGLHNAIADHLENKLLLKSGLPVRLTFVTKGRINAESYSPYIVNNQIQVAVLGNFELVTLYTHKKGELCRLLASRLEVFTILE